MCRTRRRKTGRCSARFPNERIHAHDWRGGSVQIGELPGRFVDETTQGAADWPMPIVLNRMLMEEQWDLIINVGHVVPHEVLGFANHNKNYFIGLGGKDLICAAHMAAASCGIENNLGNLITPRAGLLQSGGGRIPGPSARPVRASRARAQRARPARPHRRATSATIWRRIWQPPGSRAKRTSRCSTSRSKKIVCVMQGDEFFSTWVANKAVYRTRMALADGGELVVIAPGLKRFGEQPEVDAFIRKYGYVGTPRVMEQYRKNADMQDLAHATAHLMHGSSEGRFTITYAPGHLTQAGNRRRQLPLRRHQRDDRPLPARTHANKAGTRRPTASGSTSFRRRPPGSGRRARNSSIGASGFDGLGCTCRHSGYESYACAGCIDCACRIGLPRARLQCPVGFCHVLASAT